MRAATREIMQNDTTTDALELLRSQHEEIEDLIEDLEDSDDRIERERLFQEVADKFAAHAMVEEKMFYPFIMDAETRQQLVEATEEHLVVKRLFADMMGLDVEDEHFDAKLKVLKDAFCRHVHDEEEDKLFPVVEERLSEDELAALGNEMLAMYELLIEGEPRKQVPAETAEAIELQPMF